MFEELNKQLSFFRRIGIENFNFGVLGEKGMLGGKVPRNTDKVMSCAKFGWVRNRQGENIYLRPARGENHPVIFLDDLPLSKVIAICKKYLTLAVETSKDNFQIWIATSIPLNENQRFIVQRHVGGLVGADPGSASGEHWGRAAGYKNQKPGRNGWTVRVKDMPASESKFDPTEILATAEKSLPPSSSPPQGVRVSSSSGGADDSESANEFRFALARLRDGQSREDVVKAVSLHALSRLKRQSLSEAQEYALKTVTKASLYIQ